MNNMEKLYREVINDHFKNPRNKGLKNEGVTSHKRNPSCGDDITVEVEIENGIIKHVHHDGQGCLICCSSASVMSEVLTGKTVEDAKELTHTFFDMLMGKEVDEDMLDEASIYQGVSKYPARIKCACLPWHAFEATLGEEDE